VQALAGSPDPVCLHDCRHRHPRAPSDYVLADQGYFWPRDLRGIMCNTSQSNEARSRHRHEVLPVSSYGRTGGVRQYRLSHSVFNSLDGAFVGRGLCSPRRWESAWRSPLLNSESALENRNGLLRKSRRAGKGSNVLAVNRPTKGGSARSTTGDRNRAAKECQFNGTRSK